MIIRNNSYVFELKDTYTISNYRAKKYATETYIKKLEQLKVKLNDVKKGIHSKDIKEDELILNDFSISDDLKFLVDFTCLNKTKFSRKNISKLLIEIADLVESKDFLKELTEHSKMFIKNLDTKEQYNTKSYLLEIEFIFDDN
ncbi:hypothetical protein [Vagococcus fluvialis]|uniref:hypothetical protein n=1 Tax=Vagococcus fluvialis TaxID=2738 RepID=UPI001D0BD8E8|nr:hypothetical protein [Vagococcus fluvialis]UDM84067.1 hypothetical protein K5K96_15250 [Vagococcus fluvialis]